MKFTSLWLVASIFLVDFTLALGVPMAPSVAQQRVENAGKATVYQTASPAVVTVYAGREIGSGSIVSPDGLVLTNYHVVRRTGGRNISVKAASGNRYQGQVIAIDQRYDLALIQLNSREQLPTVPLAGSNAIQTGQPVYAIGSPFGRAGVMTTGMFNRVRSNGDLQTSVILKPGNSGGPLLNSQGEMIGINKAILESQSGESTGISLATSVLAARRLIERTRPGVIASTPARQGLPPTSDTIADRRLTADSSTPSTSGLRLGLFLDMSNLIVQQVQAGSPAAQSGIRPGDRLVAINGSTLSSFQDVQAFMSRRSSSAEFTLDRNQQLMTVRVIF